MNGSPCVVPGCTQHLNGPSWSECYAGTDSVTAPGNSEPILMCGLGQVCDEDTVVVTVWTGGEDSDIALEDPEDIREFAARLRAFAAQLERDADLIARLNVPQVAPGSAAAQ